MLIRALFVAISTMVAGSNSVYAQLTQSDLEVIQWFDQLSFPNLENSKCVRVATGHWSKSGNEQAQNSYIIAFLISEQNDSFTVFTRDLFTRTYTKSPPNTPLHEVVAFEVRDLASEAADQLSQFPLPETARNAAFRFGERASERVEIFALARVCAAQKLDGVAHQLIDLAASLPTKKSSLNEALAEEIGHAMMWRAVLDFGDPSIERISLLMKFRNFRDRFPESEHVQRARDTIEILEEMLDEERRRPEPKPQTEMTNQERIAELIFELRNQNGEQVSQPGWCDIFLDPRGEDSPAAQLRKIGYDAIPQLMAVLKDQRFTRSVGYHRDFYFSHEVLRVGECAEAIIAFIAQRRFGDHNNNNIEQEVRLWWDEVQRKGEKQVLIESVSRGDDNAPYQGSLLVEKYPDVAFEAIRNGVISSQSEWTRTRLLEIAAALRDVSVIDFLLHEMKSAPGVTTRVSAAWGLLIRDRAEPIPAICEEWKRTLLRGNTVDAGHFVDFLAHCGSDKAINALGFKLVYRSVDLRLQIVEALGETTETNHHLSFPLKGQSPGQVNWQKSDPEVEVAVEELLVTALADTEARLGMSGGKGDFSYTDPRICDMSAYSLAKRFKDKYQFDFSAPIQDRDRQLLNMQNIWRRANNLQILPLPPARFNPGLPSEQTSPKLKNVVSAETSEKRKQAITELEQLGILALPSVLEFVDTIPLDHQSRSELVALASALANVVTEVVVESNSAPTGAPLGQKLQSMKNEQLRSQNFISVLVDTVRALPKGAAGVTVTAYRFNDVTGVRLSIQLSRGDLPNDRSHVAWSTHENVEIDNINLYNSFGSSTYDHALTVDSYDDFAKAIERALNTPPKVSVRLSAALSCGSD